MTSRRLALAILLYCVGLQLLYAWFTPPFESPDEDSHFLYIHNLLETRRLPVLEDRETVFASGSAQRHHPPLYYLVGAALIAWTDRSDLADFRLRNPAGSLGIVALSNQNIFLHPSSRSTTQTGLAIWLLRLYSIALSAGTLWLIYLTGESLFPPRRLGHLAMLLVGSIPTYIGISASINNDNLVTLCYAAGVYASVRLWQQRRITRQDVIALSLILSAAALSKLTGLSLFGVVYLALLMGVYWGFYPWQAALKVVGWSLLVSAVLAGWWYLRNWQLYDDPLALAATRAIWRRDYTPQTWDEVVFEAKGIWTSFWMVLGQFNVIGPGWFYNYLDYLVVLAVPGLLLTFWRRPALRGRMAFALFVCGLLLAAFIQATRTINVSQGRILFPMLVAFAPLLVLGWVSLWGRRLTFVGLLPLMLVAVSTPWLVLFPAFRPLQIVSAVPSDAHWLDIRSESMVVNGYRLETDVVEPGDAVHLTLYFHGQHPDNPLLFVKALDPLTREVIGEFNSHPGMEPTDQLNTSKQYETRVRFWVQREVACMPCRVELIIGWFSQKTQQNVVMQDAFGGSFETILLPGPVLLKSAQPATMPAVKLDTPMGEDVTLRGYDLPRTVYVPNEEVIITFYWQSAAPIKQGWHLAFGLLDATGKVVTQPNGLLAGYPRAAWEQFPAFADVRRLRLPAETPPGNYQLYIGRDGTEHVRLPTWITVTPP